MLLSAVPNPQYMNGTVAISGLPAGIAALQFEKAQQYANMHGTLGVDGSKQGRFALGSTLSQYGVGNTLPTKPLPEYSGSVAAGMGLILPAYQDSVAGGMGVGLPAYHGELMGGMGAGLPVYDGELLGGMGTTGSLGVSMYAPLTRGGFKGEIFDSAPMPTGKWKNAPTPVMLGYGGGYMGNSPEPALGVDPVIPPPSTAGVGSSTTLLIVAALGAAAYLYMKQR